MAMQQAYIPTNQPTPLSLSLSHTHTHIYLIHIWLKKNEHTAYKSFFKMFFCLQTSECNSRSNECRNHPKDSKCFWLCL